MAMAWAAPNDSRLDCSTKYGMKRCSDGMFSACRASVFQPFLFVFFIFPAPHTGTLRNEPESAATAAAF
jgi:hypothetical protein